ncbi:unnamed protein product, partial [Effrenium voratum]
SAVHLGTLRDLPAHLLCRFLRSGRLLREAQGQVREGPKRFWLPVNFSGEFEQTKHRHAVLQLVNLE